MAEEEEVEEGTRNNEEEGSEEGLSPFGGAHTLPCRLSTLICSLVNPMNEPLAKGEYSDVPGHVARLFRIERGEREREREEREARERNLRRRTGRIRLRERESRCW